MVKKKDFKPHPRGTRDKPNPNFINLAGRPKAEITEAEVEELGAGDYTLQEMAEHFGCHIDTISARFSDALKRGRDRGNGSVKRKLFLKALDGDTSAIIWFTKNRCGYRDKQPGEEGGTTINVTLKDMSS